MSRNGLGATLAVLAVLTATPTALAAGGGGGGGGSTQACTPLTMATKVVHADGNGNSGINVQATIRNCTASPERLQLTVNVPNSGTVPFKFSTGGGALQPGGSLTMFASPIGSTPTALHYGQSYNVVGTLTTSTGTTSTVLSTITQVVTMPAGPVA